MTMLRVAFLFLVLAGLAFFALPLELGRSLAAVFSLLFVIFLFTGVAVLENFGVKATSIRRALRGARRAAVQR